jgi:hypothetical protein
MTVALQTARPQPVLPLLPPSHTHRFSVTEYEVLADLGLLTTNDRVELLEGWIVDKMTQYPPHATSVDLVQDALRPLLPPGWLVREQKPIKTSDSMPEPDVAAVRGPRRRYARRHPEPADIGLLVEVSDTTLDDDRSRKGRIYARARISVYWIVNLQEDKVEVYTEPKGGKAPAYRRREDYGRDDAVPLLIDGRILAHILVRDLLPR